MVPLRIDGDCEEDVSQSGGDGEAGEDSNKDQADDAEPLLDKDAAVEEDQGDAGKRVGDGVEDVEAESSLEWSNDEQEDIVRGQSKAAIVVRR